MAFFSKNLVKNQENLKNSQEKFLSLTCGNPEYVIIWLFFIVALHIEFYFFYYLKYTN